MFLLSTSTAHPISSRLLPFINFYFLVRAASLIFNILKLPFPVIILGEDLGTTLDVASHLDTGNRVVFINFILGYIFILLTLKELIILGVQSSSGVIPDSKVPRFCVVLLAT